MDFVFIGSLSPCILADWGSVSARGRDRKSSSHRHKGTLGELVVRALTWLWARLKPSGPCPRSCPALLPDEDELASLSARLFRVAPKMVPSAPDVDSFSVNLAASGEKLPCREFQEQSQEGFSLVQLKSHVLDHVN